VKSWQKGAVIGGLIGFLFHTTVIWYIIPTSVFRGMGIDGNFINLLRSTIIGALIGFISFKALIKFNVIKDSEKVDQSIEHKNTRDDYLIPIGLSSILVVLGLFGVSLVIALGGNGNPPMWVWILILTTYLIMFFFTKFTERKGRMLVFPIISLLGVFMILIGWGHVSM
jgi:hypothetical protein